MIPCHKVLLSAGQSPVELHAQNGDVEPVSYRSVSPMRVTSRIRELFLRCLKDVIRRRRIPFNISIVNDAMRKVCTLSGASLA